MGARADADCNMSAEMTVRRWAVKLMSTVIIAIAIFWSLEIRLDSDSIFPDGPRFFTDVRYGAPRPEGIRGYLQRLWQVVHLGTWQIDGKTIRVKYRLMSRTVELVGERLPGQ